MRDEIKVPLQPVQTKRASEEIYSQIKKLILDGEIKPGQRLPSERKMMDMMHRSRPTIREAMRMLEREGYIKTYSGSSGAVVQEINVDHAVQSLENIMQFKMLTMEDILEFRKMTEGTAARFAASRRNIEQLRRMEEILQRAEEAIGDKESFIAYDLQFHHLVAEMSGNIMYDIMLQVCRNVIGETLTDILRKGTNEERRLRYERILEVHRTVFEAILEHREEQAYLAMDRHLSDAAEDILHDQY